MKTPKALSNKVPDYPSPVLLHPWQVKQALNNLMQWKMSLPTAGGWTKWPLRVPYNPNQSMTLQFHDTEGSAQCGSTFLQNGLQGKIHIKCLCRDSLQASQVQTFASLRLWQRSWAWHIPLLLRECCHWSDSLPSGYFQSGSTLHKPRPWACLPIIRHYLIILWDCSLGKCASLPSKAFSMDRNGELRGAGVATETSHFPFLGPHGEKLLNSAPFPQSGLRQGRVQVFLKQLNVGNSPVFHAQDSQCIK